MDPNDHPRGALLLMILFLTFLAAMWVNVYLHLFNEGWPR